MCHWLFSGYLIVLLTFGGCSYGVLEGVLGLLCTPGLVQIRSLTRVMGKFCGLLGLQEFMMKEVVGSERF